MNATKLSASEADTQALAGALAVQCKTGDVLLLEGDVGAGKTTFARAFIQAVSDVQNDIVSPTFTLVQTYPLRSGATLYHYDLYRLKHAEELLELGLDDALENGITLMEWPALARAQLPDTALTIAIDVEANARLFHFSGDASTWETRLAAL